MTHKDISSQKDPLYPVLHCTKTTNEASPDSFHSCPRAQIFITLKNLRFSFLRNVTKQLLTCSNVSYMAWHGVSHKLVENTGERNCKQSNFTESGGKEERGTKTELWGFVCQVLAWSSQCLMKCPPEEARSGLTTGANHEHLTISKRAPWWFSPNLKAIFLSNHFCFSTDGSNRNYSTATSSTKLQ